MKRGPFLLDTGFLVALINARDPDHEACADVWARIAGPFVTTEGVLVESAHLLRRSQGGYRAAWSLLRAVGTVVVAASRPRLDRAVELMAQYEDVPMNLVDALLVALAEETHVADVLTLDRRGFRAYRTTEGRKFTLHPAR